MDIWYDKLVVLAAVGHKGRFCLSPDDEISNYIPIQAAEKMIELSHTGRRKDLARDSNNASFTLSLANKQQNKRWSVQATSILKFLCLTGGLEQNVSDHRMQQTDSSKRNF
jgi:hypothetical protein